MRVLNKFKVMFQRIVNRIRHPKETSKAIGHYYKRKWMQFKKDIKTKRGRKYIVKSFFYNLFMIYLSLMFLFPTIFMIMSAMKTEEKIYEHITSWRAFWFSDAPVATWMEGYRQVFERFEIFEQMKFSFQYAAFLIVGTILINSLAGYALAKFDFPFKGFWMAFIITLIIVPVETTIIPLYVVANEFGLVGTFQGLFIPGLANAFNIFLFRQFFMSIPKELEEAALIDGAGRFTIYFKIILPLSKPVFATVAIFAFIAAWNDFLWPILILGGSDTMPLQVYLTEMINTYPVYMNQVMAALTIATIPIFLIYAFFQKYIVQGVAHTGIK